MIPAEISMNRWIATTHAGSARVTSMITVSATLARLPAAHFDLAHHFQRVGGDASTTLHLVQQSRGHIEVLVECFRRHRGNRALSGSSALLLLQTHSVVQGGGIRHGTSVQVVRCGVAAALNDDQWTDVNEVGRVRTIRQSRG